MLIDYSLFIIYTPKFCIDSMIQESIWFEWALRKAGDTIHVSTKEQEELEEFGAFGQNCGD